MPPNVPGFVAAGDMGTSATGSEWVAVRSLDGLPFTLKAVPVADLPLAQALAARQQARYDLIENEHLVRRHGAVALSDGTLVLVLDEVIGGTLAQLLGVRGQLTVGETVTTVVPLFRALADLHDAGVVHGDLAPGKVLFSADGRPLIGDLGVADLLGRQVGPVDGASGFLAPELLDVLGDGASPTPASDVYAMAALGWLCLTGAPPAPAATRPSLTTLRPETPPALAELLTAALATEPEARLPAGGVAVGVFDSAPAESVALASLSDPAAEITRRIRAGARPVPDPAPPGTGKWYRAPMLVGLALLLAVALGGGTTWFLRQSPPAPHLRAVKSASQPPSQSTVRPSEAPERPPQSVVRPTPATRPTSPREEGSAKASPRLTTVGTAFSSPREAPSGLVQALVDARALAYLTRDPALLRLVYTPSAKGAAVDKRNITAAVRNGGTYLGLSYVAKDAVFLDGSSRTARIRATILTPAYQTGQPDGRKIPHAQEILGPCIFTLSKTPDGWRILDLTLP